MAVFRPRCTDGHRVLRNLRATLGFSFLGLLALGVSLWIVVPGPTPSLFALTVGTTELWPLITCIDAVICVVLMCYSRGALRAVSLAVALASLAISVVPAVAYAGRGPYVPFRALLSVHDGTELPVTMRTLRDGNIVYAPRAAQTLPIVVAIYGGAWQRGSPRNDRLLNETIASWGYVVVAIDYPHAPQARWPAQREAVLRELARVRVLAPTLGGDATRIVLLGHSSGAQLAVIATSLRQDDVRGLVTYESPVDLQLGYYHPSQPDVIHIQAILRDLCGDTPQQAPACYRGASPRYAVRRGMPPVLMFAAGRDHVADLGYERILRDTLRRAGAPVDYVELAWADHAFETLAYGFHDRIALWYLRRFLAAVRS